MEIYNVFWKDIWIGVLSVKEDGLYKYQAKEEEINRLKDTVPFDPILMESKDWGEAIPFFKSRLECAEKFPDLEIGFPTDSYRLKKVSKNV